MLLQSTVWNVSSERCRPDMLPYTVIAYIITEYLLFIILMDHFQLHREQVKRTHKVEVDERKKHDTQIKRPEKTTNQIWNVRKSPTMPL